MKLRVEYTRFLSQGLHEDENAAIGIARKYLELLNTPFTDYKLLDEVYNELVSLYIQSEVGLMKAFIYRMGYPILEQKFYNLISKDLNTIFYKSREHMIDEVNMLENFSLPTGQEMVIDYEMFQYIDELNRAIEVENDNMFEVIQRKIRLSPYKNRLKKIFLLR